jgi:hypothetical protein
MDVGVITAWHGMRHDDCLWVYGYGNGVIWRLSKVRVCVFIVLVVVKGVV